MSERPRGTGALQVGEQVLLIDTKGRRYLVTIEEDGEFHSHNGFVPHADIRSGGEGARIMSTKGTKYHVIRPTLADYVLKMPRGAQVIYPKDLGPLLLLADIFPGVRVLESGVGSGALSMTMLRAGAHITGYEIREDFAERARGNVAAFLGAEVLDRYDVSIRDVYEGITETDLDRVVLDLPEPWNVVNHAADSLRQGGVFVAYTPSITQAARLRQELEESAFGLADTIEVLNRGWHIEGPAVRPNHRMVAHTGFLTQARLLDGPLRADLPAARPSSSRIAEVPSEGLEED